MLNFDELRLKEELTKMPSLCRLTFAVAVAARQLTSYESYARLQKTLPLDRPRKIVADLWAAIQSNNLSNNEWRAILDEVMDLIPQEDVDYSGFLDLMAQHDLLALAYAIRYVLSADPQEAAWAGLCEYEAADQASIKTLKIDFAAPEAERQVLSHVFVQRALQAQHADLQLLKAGQLMEVCRRAQESPTFTDKELEGFA